MATKFADDQINPTELGILGSAAKRIKRGDGILVPASDKTLSHLTLARPDPWKQYLTDLMAWTP